MNFELIELFDNYKSERCSDKQAYYFAALLKGQNTLNPFRKSIFNTITRKTTAYKDITTKVISKKDMMQMISLLTKGTLLTFTLNGKKATQTSTHGYYESFKILLNI